MRDKIFASLSADGQGAGVKSLSRRKFIQGAAAGLSTAAIVGVMGARNRSTAPAGVATSQDELVAMMKMKVVPTCPFCGENPS